MDGEVIQMVMLLILAAVTLLCGYGILQTKKQGNVFGVAFSFVSFLTFAFTTVLAFTMM